MDRTTHLLENFEVKCMYKHTRAKISYSTLAKVSLEEIKCKAATHSTGW
jgi:hypothetical protein